MVRRKENKKGRKVHHSGEQNKEEGNQSSMEQTSNIFSNSYQPKLNGPTRYNYEKQTNPEEKFL